MDHQEGIRVRPPHVPKRIRADVPGCARPELPQGRLRWSPRWLVATAAVLLGLGWSLPTVAVCQVAPLENVKECFSDPTGRCCVVVFDTPQGKCAGAYCIEYDACEWKTFVPVECMEH